MKVRHAMSDYIRSVTTIPLPPQTAMPILDFEVRKPRLESVLLARGGGWFRFVAVNLDIPRCIP